MCTKVTHIINLNLVRNMKTLENTHTHTHTYVGNYKKLDEIGLEEIGT
jgi:hypothetical protein